MTKTTMHTAKRGYPIDLYVTEAQADPITILLAGFRRLRKLEGREDTLCAPSIDGEETLTIRLTIQDLYDVQLWTSDDHLVAERTEVYAEDLRDAIIEVADH